MLGILFGHSGSASLWALTKHSAGADGGFLSSSSRTYHVLTSVAIESLTLFALPGKRGSDDLVK